MVLPRFWDHIDIRTFPIFTDCSKINLSPPNFLDFQKMFAWGRWSQIRRYPNLSPLFLTYRKRVGKDSDVSLESLGQMVENKGGGDSRRRKDSDLLWSRKHRKGGSGGREMYKYPLIRPLSSRPLYVDRIKLLVSINYLHKCQYESGKCLMFLDFQWKLLCFFQNLQGYVCSSFTRSFRPVKTRVRIVLTVEQLFVFSDFSTINSDGRNSHSPRVAHDSLMTHSWLAHGKDVPPGKCWLSFRRFWVCV